MNDCAHSKSVEKLLLCWDVKIGKVRHDISLGGSPRRCLQRLAVEDAQGDIYVLEGIVAEQAGKRKVQAEILQLLTQNGLPLLQPWLANMQGEFLQPDGQQFWQLRRYAHGIELPRETYGNDAWRGKAMGDFLTRLRIHAHALEGLPMPVFSLTDYINEFLKVLQIRHPALHSDLLPIWQELAEFQESYRQLPLAFCHGDYHPLNIIWGEETIHGVIDWEFMGRKVEAWDLANLLGCLGMDEPAWLTSELANTIIKSLHQAGIFHQVTWHWLPELVAALRFAWMREWFHEQNRKMQIQELDYLWLLLDNRKLLRQKWAPVSTNG